MTTATLTVELSSELENRLDALADTTHRAKSVLASEAIERYVARELDIVEEIERAREDARAGRIVPHATVMEDVERIMADARRET